MAELPRASINESSADYELIQPGADHIKSTSGYSTQDTTPAHLRVPPKHPPPILPRKPYNQPSQQRHYRLTPKARNRLSNSRQRNYRLSQSQRRNYAELQGNRDSEVHYDIPTHYCRDEGQVHRYDAFFEGSLDNQSLENDETYRQTLVEPKPLKYNCNCSCVVVKNVLCIVIVIVTLLVALAALGIVLQMKLAEHKHSTHSTSSDNLWCSVTVTMSTSSFTCMTNSTGCTIMTEGLPVNKSGVTSSRFHCEAIHQYPQPPSTYSQQTSTYNNSLYRDSERAYCVCQFETNVPYKSCTIVGDYCMEQDNSTASDL